MNASDWDIRREGRRWSHEEFERRVYQAPEKIEFVGGIFASERERLNVLAMLLENLGIDKAVQLGKLEDWKAAIAERGKREGLGKGNYTEERRELLAGLTMEDIKREVARLPKREEPGGAAPAISGDQTDAAHGERTLDEALDEIDRWSEKMNRELEGLSTEQVLEYFNGAQARLEKSLGRPLNLPVRGAPAKPTSPPGLIAADQALAIAQSDALTAYRDLSPFRVQLVLEDDGWHVDYKLKKTGWVGGGPHYVIDARTGAIASKRYEQ